MRVHERSIDMALKECWVGKCGLECLSPLSCVLSQLDVMTKAEDSNQCTPEPLLKSSPSLESAKNVDYLIKLS